MVGLLLIFEFALSGNKKSRDFSALQKESAPMPRDMGSLGRKLLSPQTKKAAVGGDDPPFEI
jgi:hypothetical protein